MLLLLVNVIHIFTTSGAKQPLSRPGDESSPSERRWLLHLQSQLWRCVWLQPVGSGGRPECRHVLRYDITVSCSVYCVYKCIWLKVHVILHICQVYVLVAGVAICHMFTSWESCGNWTSNLNVFPNKAGIFSTGCSRQHIDDVSPPTRAELSFLRRSAEVGDPASVTAAACWGKPAAGVWSRGTADPSVPVAQEWSPSSQRHKEETRGEEIIVWEVLWCYYRLCIGKRLLIQYESWGLQFNILQY